MEIQNIDNFDDCLKFLNDGIVSFRLMDRTQETGFLGEWLVDLDGNHITWCDFKSGKVEHHKLVDDDKFLDTTVGALRKSIATMMTSLITSRDRYIKVEFDDGLSDEICERILFSHRLKTFLESTDIKTLKIEKQSGAVIVFNINRDNNSFTVCRSCNGDSTRTVYNDLKSVGEYIITDCDNEVVTSISNNCVVFSSKVGWFDVLARLNLLYFFGAGVGVYLFLKLCGVYEWFTFKT